MYTQGEEPHWRLSPRVLAVILSGALGASLLFAWGTAPAPPATIPAATTPLPASVPVSLPAPQKAAPAAAPAAISDAESAATTAFRKRLAALRGQLQSASRPEDTLAVYQYVLDGAGETALGCAISDPDPSIALQAAWRLYGLPSGPDGAARPERFLGFVEGRLGLRPPLRWQIVLTKIALVKSPGLLANELARYATVYPLLKRLGAGDIFALHPEPVRGTFRRSHYFGADVIATADGAFVTVTQGPRTARLRAQDAAGLGMGQSDFCKAYIGNSATVIACYDHDLSGQPFGVACFDTEAGRLRWRESCWGIGGRIGPLCAGGAPTRHGVEIVLGDRSVAVFGEWGLHGCYLQEFDINTGASKVWFSTK